MVPKLLEDNGHNPYSQIGQHSDVQWATIGENEHGLYQTHPWFKCKDYLNEYVASGRTGESYSAHGFTYDAKTHRLPSDGKFHVLMKSSKLEVIKAAVEKYLHPIEEEAGLVRTFFEDIDGERVHIIADELYVKEPLFISAFALIIRNFFYADSIEGDDLIDYSNKLADQEIQNTQVAKLREKTSLSLLKLLIINMKSLVGSDQEFIERMNTSKGSTYIHGWTGIFNTTNYLAGKKRGIDVSGYEGFFGKFYPDTDKWCNALLQGEKS